MKKLPLTPQAELHARLESTTLRELAKKLDVSPGYLGDVASGRRPPSDRLIGALGLQRVVVYRRVYKRKPQPNTVVQHST